MPRVFEGFSATWKEILLLAVVAFGVYGASLKNGFVLDDGQQVVDNALTESLARIPAVFRGASSEQNGDVHSYGVYFRPLMITSYTLIRSCFGLDPAAFHFVQLAIHLLNSILLMFLFREFVGRRIALLGGLFFLVHPMNGESVTYIAALQDPLYAFFGLSALAWCATRKEIRSREVAVAAVLFLCGMLSKETGALFVLMAIIFGFSFRGKSRWKISLAAVVAMACYLAMRVGYAGLTSAEHSSSQIARATFGQRFLTVPAVLFSYLSKFPFPRSLSTNQDWMVRSWEDPLFWGAGVFAIGLLFILVWLVSRRGWKSPFAFFFWWSFLGLGLHSQLLNPLDGTVAERWFYFPCMGLLGLTLVGIEEIKSQLQNQRRWLVPALAGVFVFFSGKSFSRAMDWESDYTLALADTQTDPTSPFMWNNLGAELYKRGEFARALEPLEKSIALNPQWNISWNNIGAVRQQLGDLRQAEEAFLRSMDYGPHVLAYRNYPTVLILQGKRQEAKKFLETRALQLFPGDPVLKKLSEYVK